MFYITLDKSKPKANPVAKYDSYDDRYVYIAEERISASGNNSAIIPEEDNLTLFPFFRDIQRENQMYRILVAGKSGSGKSTWIGTFLDQISSLRAYRNHTIVIFSWVDSDEPLDRIRNGEYPFRVDLYSDELFEYTPELLANCIVIMDDVENGVDKERVKFLLRLRSMLSEVARHNDTQLVFVSHDILAGWTNKTIKNESTHVVLFPRHNNWRAMSSYLKSYVGVSDEQILDIKRLPSRWVCISLNAPQYYVHDKGVVLLTE